MNKQSSSAAQLPETLPMTWSEKYHEQGFGCPLCGKKFTVLENKSFIHVGEGGASIMRVDLPLGGMHNEAAILSDGTVDDGDMGWFEIGSGCAKKLGSAWHKKLEPLAPLSSAE